MLYPLKFVPIYKNIIWGGRNLEKYYNRDLPEGLKIGESWELTYRNEGISLIENGKFTGISIKDLISKYPAEILGNDYINYKEHFPLLIKIIDANDDLSVQVHPSGFNGKTETWYVLKANENSRIVHGLKKGITKEHFIDAIRNNYIEEILNYINVKSGDVIHVPAGIVHALGKGIIVAEIQQNCNTTYRIYDWNRTDEYGNKRQLHIEQALNSINFNSNDIYNIEFISTVHNMNNSFIIHSLVNTEFYDIYNIEIIDKYYVNIPRDIFKVLIITSGDFNILYNNDNVERVSALQTILLPASIRQVFLHGKGNLLLIVPK